jgi:glutathionylspermidine synthase
MPRLLSVPPLEPSLLEKLGFTWHTDSDGSRYIAEEMLIISRSEAQAYYEAASTLYAMYEQAAEHVIEHERYEALDIPENLVSLIKQSWQHERGRHLYSRFDLAGGIDGQPVKLIEFNADTPTMLFETAVIQWIQLKQSFPEDAVQFNTLYQSISAFISSIVPAGEPMLFCSVDRLPEEQSTVRLLQQMAGDARTGAVYETLEQIHLDERGVYDRYDTHFAAWFKLYPWEVIAEDHPHLIATLEQAVQTRQLLTLNPAYTLLYQSKGMLAILSELFPDSPYLLHASCEPLDVKQVRKPMFGREGANVEILDANASSIDAKSGPYGDYRSLYQEYIPFPEDTDGHVYQAGVFYCNGPCGLGFRRGGEILDNMSKFVGHVINS